MTTKTVCSEYDYTGTAIDGFILGNPFWSDGMYRWEAPIEGFINEFGQLEVTSTW